mgnify:CR=1 FL=1
MKKTVKIEELPQQLDVLIKELNDTDEPVFITQDGREVAVLVSPAVWQRVKVFMKWRFSV